MRLAVQKVSRWLLGLTWVLPVVLLALFFRREVAMSRDRDHAADAEQRQARVDQATCEPREKGRVVIALIDSLLAETSDDPRLMPWLVSQRAVSLHGRLEPCLSQISLLCFRTVIEGREPVASVGFDNFTGGQVVAPNLFARLAARELRSALASDGAITSLYAPHLARLTVAAAGGDGGRDRVLEESALRWLGDPEIDVVVLHLLDTDAIAHRHGVGHPAYDAVFRQADGILQRVAGRMGPHDTLIVLGDHGHDRAGRHTAGVDAGTVFVARGPAFAPGRRLDLRMEDMYLLLSVATCEPLPPGYRSSASFPPDVFRLPPKVKAVYETAAPAGGQLRGYEREAEGWMPYLVLLVVFVIAPTRLASRSAEMRSFVLVNAAGFAVALWWPTTVALWALTAVDLALLWGSGPGARTRHERVLWALLGVALVVGWAAPSTLTFLHQNGRMFWFRSVAAAALVTVTGVAALVANRRLRQPLGRTWALCTWAVVFFAFGFGPYCYGTGWHIAAALAGVGLAHVGPRWWRERRWRDVVLLTVVPLLPLMWPRGIEWRTEFPILTPLNALPGWAQTVALAAVGVIGARAAGPQRAPRLAAVVLGFVAAAHLTDVAPGARVAGVLLLLSYAGWAALVRRLAFERRDVRHLHAIGAASYVYLLYFVLLGPIQFASIDYRFALTLVAPGRGDAVAALVAVPLTFVKYTAPLALILLLAPPSAGGAWLMLIKASALAAAYAGMDLAGPSRIRLFQTLHAQETLLLVVPYVILVLRLAAARHAVAIAGR